MLSKKYDVFVTSLKHPNPEINLVTEEIKIKLFQLLRMRLGFQGFADIDVDVQRYVAGYTLTENELETLRNNPVFLSEHYLTQPIVLDPQHVIVNQFTAPWKMRPSIDSYLYVDRGKRPMFHVMVIGKTNAGKTYVYNELKLLLKGLSTDIQIIDCDNDIRFPEYWDITSDPIAYEEYKGRVNTNTFCFGNGPTFRVDTVDNQLQSTVNF